MINHTARQAALLFFTGIFPVVYKPYILVHLPEIDDAFTAQHLNWNLLVEAVYGRYSILVLEVVFLFL